MSKDRSLDASTRLYKYLKFDIDHLMTAPYNLAGIFTEDIMSDPAFAGWEKKRRQVHSCVERILSDGIKTGAFVLVTPRLVAETIAGILVGVLTYHSGGRQGDRGSTDEIVGLLMRGLLSNQGELDRLKKGDVDF